MEGADILIVLQMLFSKRAKEIAEQTERRPKWAIVLQILFFECANDTILLCLMDKVKEFKTA